MVDNTYLNNNEQDIVEEFYTREDSPEVPKVLLLFEFAGFTGFIVIALLAGLIVGKRVSVVE